MPVMNYSDEVIVFNDKESLSYIIDNKTLLKNTNNYVSKRRGVIKKELLGIGKFLFLSPLFFFVITHGENGSCFTIRKFVLKVNNCVS